MANINQNPNFSSAKGYNGFDMSQDVSFTSAVGQLIPCYYDILNPGDKVDLKSIFVSRTLELDSSANQEITDVVDYFFVPLEQLNSYFGELFYGVFDPKTSNKVLSDGSNNYLPYTNLGALNTAIKTATDPINPHERWDSLRLCGSLGIPLDAWQMKRTDTDNERIMVDLPDQYTNRAISLWLPLAYQKIFNDYYRLDDRTAPVVTSFNTDAFINTNVSITDAGTLQAIFKMHYRPWRKDFFTNLFTSPIAPAGDYSFSSSSQTSLLPSQLEQFTTWLTQSVPASVNNSTSAQGTPTQVYADDATTANIRNAFAFEKYLEVTRRAGKNYDAQTLAHFGHKVPRGVTNQVSYLGTHTAKYNIGDVISTASTAEGSLGDIAGKGFGYNKNDNDIKFEAPVHGVFMAVYSAVPSVTYKSLGIDKLNEKLGRTDFFIPEYDNLGMQPLFMSQQRVWDFSNYYSDPNDILGWQYRYSEFKTKYDKAEMGLLGSLSSWLPTKWVQAPANSEPLGRWYIPYNYLDPMMLVKYNPSLGSLADFYASDPLMHFFKFDVRKASKMSTYSLPQL